MPGYVKMAELTKQLIEGGERHTPVDIVTPQFGERASGEPFIKLGSDHIGGHDCVILMSGPGTYKTLVQIYLLLDYLVGRRAARISIVTGYLPLGRSDKDEGALEFAIAAHFVHMIQCAAHGKLDRVIAADLHAPQVAMAADHLGVITEIFLARRLITGAVEEARRIQENICVLLPDDGATKRFETTVKKCGQTMGIELPLIYATKRRIDSRSSALGSLSGDLDRLSGAIIIAPDDEIATGGTNLHAAEVVKSQYGAKAYWATAIHGVLCGAAPIMLAEKSSAIDRVIVSNTIPVEDRDDLAPLRESGRLKIISWAPDLAHIVDYHHWGKSVREIR